MPTMTHGESEVGVVSQEINVGIHYRARTVANTIQSITNCSDASTEILIRALIDFGQEIKRQAIEP